MGWVTTRPRVFVCALPCARSAWVLIHHACIKLLIANRLLGAHQGVFLSLQSTLTVDLLLMRLRMHRVIQLRQLEHLRQPGSTIVPGVDGVTETLVAGAEIFKVLRGGATTVPRGGVAATPTTTTQDLLLRTTTRRPVGCVGKKVTDSGNAHIAGMLAERAQ